MPTNAVDIISEAIGDGHSSDCNTCDFVDSDEPCNCGGLDRATVAIAALELAGLVVVQAMPTEEMLDNGADAYHTACEAEKERRAEQGRRPRAFPNDWLPAVYRAMLGASAAGREALEVGE